MGCRAARMPTAQYSWRAMSPNSRTSSGSRRAASPRGSGHCENDFAANETPAFSMNACRGSVEIVTGMPCGVLLGDAPGARCASAPPSAASSRACTLKWVRCLRSTTSEVADLLIAPGPSRTVPSAPASMTVWNIRPTFSSSESRASRSSTRSSTVRRGSSNGSIRPLPLRSRYSTPSGLVFLTGCMGSSQWAGLWATGRPVSHPRHRVPRAIRGCSGRAVGPGRSGDAGAELFHADDRTQRPLDVGGAERAADHVVRQTLPIAPMTMAWSSDR